MNVMEPDLLRLRSGKIAFAFCRKNSEADCRPMFRLSSNDGKTFTEPKPIADRSLSFLYGNQQRSSDSAHGGRSCFPSGIRRTTGSISTSARACITPMMKARHGNRARRC